MSNRVTYVCESCGSKEIKYDAWAYWDEESQALALDSTYEHVYCISCDNSTKPKEIIIEDEN